MIFTFRCPEVGLEFSLLCVQRLDWIVHSYVSRGWIRISYCGLVRSLTSWCSQVGLKDLDVQRFDYNYASRGWILESSNLCRGCH